jgi:hypothetical protein
MQCGGHGVARQHKGLWSSEMLRTSLGAGSKSFFFLTEKTSEKVFFASQKRIFEKAVKIPLTAL